MESHRIIPSSTLVIATLLLVACGGSGSGGGGGGGGGVADSRLQVFETASSGLIAHNPASPGTTTVLDADADFSNVNSIPVLGATWNNGQTDDGYVRRVVYQNSSGHLMQVSTDASGGVTPTPQRVSDNTSTACRFNIGQDFADVENVRIAFQRCSDDEWWWTVLNRDENGKIVPFPGEPLVDLVDPADGSHDGWLGLEAGEIKHLSDGGSTTTVTNTPAGIGDALHLESIETGHVMLNIDGELWVYHPGDGLTDLSYAFTNDTCIAGPANCPVLYAVDDSELFFIDNNRLYRTDLAADDTQMLDENAAPPQFATGGRRLAVSTERVVWSYETDPTPGNPLSGDEETVLRTVNKSTGSGSDLDRFTLLDPVVSAMNQPFLDRTGDWFFYTRADGLNGVPTAVAARMDGSNEVPFANAAWRGSSVNLISFANLDQGLKRVYLIDGINNTGEVANKNIKSVPASSPGGTPLNLGTVPADAQGLSVSGGFGIRRLVSLTADDGGGGTQEDLLYLDGDAAGSLQRVRDTTGEDEIRSPFF